MRPTIIAIGLFLFSGCVSMRQYEVEYRYLSNKVDRIDKLQFKMLDMIEDKADDPGVTWNRFNHKTADVDKAFEALAEQAAKETDEKFKDRLRELLSTQADKIGWFPLPRK